MNFALAKDRGGYLGTRKTKTNYQKIQQSNNPNIQSPTSRAVKQKMMFFK